MRRSEAVSAKVRLLLLIFVLLHQGCSPFSGPRHHSEVRSPETVKAGTLPLPPGHVHHLEFDDPSDGVRRIPMGVTALSVGQGAGDPGAMSAMASDLTAKAVTNSKVRQVLGSRYTLISITVIDLSAKHLSGCCTGMPPKHRLMFYSYTNDVAVDVEMKGDDVITVVRRDRSYLPPEGEDEIQQAIDLARKDSRIPGGLPQLDGHAILMQPGDGVLWNEPGYGHRVFWVTFSKGLSGNPEYWAVVDMSAQTVLKVEKEDVHP
jgi:hypothetical protein